MIKKEVLWPSSSKTSENFIENWEKKVKLLILLCFLLKIIMFGGKKEIKKLQEENAKLQAENTSLKERVSRLEKDLKEIQANVAKEVPKE